MTGLNLIVFGLLALLLFGAAIQLPFKTWEWELSRALLILCGLILVPGTFLFAGQLERALRSRAMARTLAAGYNGASALLLAWYGITADPVAHPLDKGYALIFAVFAAMNAVKLSTSREIASGRAKPTSGDGSE